MNLQRSPNRFECPERHHISGPNSAAVQVWCLEHMDRTQSVYHGNADAQAHLEKHPTKFRTQLAEMARWVNWRSPKSSTIGFSEKMDRP